MTKIIVCCFMLLLAGSNTALGSGDWDGHDFAFCFVTDDGTKCNLAWADTAAAMDFRFTIAVNVNCEVSDWNKLSRSEIHDLWLDGFEIAQHGVSHGNNGLADNCTFPPRGSWMGYFLCPDPSETSRMASLMTEVERDSIETWTGVPTSDIRVAAYPRHRHGKALIDSLIAEGFIGARTGGKWDYETNSYGDFTTMARNSWDGGISLYRLPIANSETFLFGNHSATPPAHRSYDEFRAKADLAIAPFQESGGICVVYTHHLGNDNDTCGDINYASGGITKQELAWLADYVREKNGKIMTLGDAISYYRQRTVMEEIDGDLVWKPGISTVDIAATLNVDNFLVHPNPFNPVTWIGFDLKAASRANLAVFDMQGRLIKRLVDGNLQAGYQRYSWKGRDSNGRRVGSGPYFIRLRTEGETVSRTVTIIK